MPTDKIPKKRNDKYNGENPRDRNPHPKVAEVMDYLDRIGMDIDDVLDLTGYKRGSLFTKSNHFPTDGSLMPFPKQLVNKLHLTTGIHPSIFLIDEELQNEWLDENIKATKTKTIDEVRENYFTHDYWRTLEPYFSAANSIIKYIRIHSHDANSNIELEQVYKTILAPYFLNARHTVKIYEVLFKGTNREPDENKAYQKAQRYVLEAIQKWLDNMKELNDKIIAENKILKKNGEREKELLKYKYIRTFACSRSTYIFRKKGDDELRQAMVLEASARTIEHLNYCFKEHSKNCEFYVTTTKRLRNHALIDDEYSLTEDYYTTPDNIVVPDGIFINDVCPNSKTHPFKQALEKDVFKGISFTEADLREYLIESYFLVTKASEEKHNNADLIRKKLNIENVAKDEDDKGKILQKYEIATHQKISNLGWAEILKEEIRERKKLKT